MGTGFRTGYAVPLNRLEAANWYRKAALQGHAKAQYFLGELYANGQGVPEDYVQSYAWMLLAKNGGDQKAKVNIEILAGEMTEDQISDAQLLVSKLRQQIENKDEP